MIDYVDRQPVNPNVYSMTKTSGGTAENVKLVLNDGATVQGTLLNRKSFMDIQGFSDCDITINQDETVITEVYDDGTMKTTINGDVITEVFTGKSGNVITKTTTITGNTIKEVLS